MARAVSASVPRVLLVLIFLGAPAAVARAVVKQSNTEIRKPRIRQLLRQSDGLLPWRQLYVYSGGLSRKAAKLSLRGWLECLASGGISRTGQNAEERKGVALRQAQRLMNLLGRLNLDFS